MSEQRILEALEKLTTLTLAVAEQSGYLSDEQLMAAPADGGRGRDGKIYPSLQPGQRARRERLLAEAAATAAETTDAAARAEKAAEQTRRGQALAASKLDPLTASRARANGLLAELRSRPLTGLPDHQVAAIRNAEAAMVKRVEMIDAALAAAELASRDADAARAIDEVWRSPIRAQYAETGPDWWVVSDTPPGFDPIR